MDADNVRQQVLNGFRITAIGLLAWATIGLLWGGIITVTAPERGISANSPLLRFLFLGSHPIIGGWICLIVSTVILLLTMDSWAKGLPGILLCEALSVPLMLSGKVNGVRVPREVKIFLITFLLAAFVASFRFIVRELRVMDRVALMGFQVCVALGVTPNTSTMVVALNCALVCLLFPWAVDFFFNRKSDKWPPPPENAS